jgi:uncharacterized protein YbbC (DUF1343 family)
LGRYEFSSLADCEGLSLVSKSFLLKIKIILFAILIFHSDTFCQSVKVKVGADVLFAKHLSQLVGKRVGVICNQTSVLSNRVHVVDSLLKSGINVTTLFSPEHGIRGKLPAGQKFESGVDEKTGLPVYSLYGNNFKPTAEMLNELDVIIFDLQDVGVRFYTYSITMAYAMQAAAENGKQFIVLDRPNPINGIEVEGTILDTALKSGVGLLQIPVRHGLTLGEMARMIVGENWLDNISELDLQVIPMTGWKREMFFNETHLRWISPSPNMKTPSTAIVYPGTCLIEGTNVSEGRGTKNPFEYIGAPWINAKRLAKKLNTLNLPGINFQPISFTPKSESVVKNNIKFHKILCNGVFLKINNPNIFKPVMTGMKLIQTLSEMYPDSFTFNSKFFDRLLGTAKFKVALEAGKTDTYFQNEYKLGLDDFLKKRQKYLIY